MTRVSLLALTILLSGYTLTKAQSQYVEPEEKAKVTELFPEVPFDSLEAKRALSLGKGTITGVAFTKPKTSLGYKAPLAQRIYANKLKIVLLPASPYVLAWLELRKDKENFKKRRYVYLSNEAYKWRLEAVTNSKGKFTFPNMKPGKYFLTASMDWDSYGSYNNYTGSGYNSYGGRTDYYEKKNYSVAHTDRLEEFVEVKEDGEVVNVKLK